MKRLVLYLDESGISDLTDRTERFFLLTGLVIDDNEDRELSGYFNFLKRSYHLDQDKSLHAYDLFENKKSSVYLLESKASRLTMSLIEFIKITPIKIRVVSVDKTLLRAYLNLKNDDDFKGSEKKRRDKDIPYEMLSINLFHWFADIAKNQDARGAIIAESRKNADYTLLRTYLRCQEKGSFNQTNLKKSCDSMTKHVSSIRFESKIGVRTGLELADIISYVSFLNINKRIRKQEFRKRGLINLWHAIEKKVEKNKIQIFSKSRFSKYINQNRVRKTSK